MNNPNILYMLMGLGIR